MSHATDPEKKTTATKSSRAAGRRWAHPLALNDPNEAESLRTYFAAITAMAHGYFPPSPNDYFNDSLYLDVHVEDAFLLYDGFRCIADGEVIAYLKKRGGEP